MGSELEAVLFPIPARHGRPVDKYEEAPTSHYSKFSEKLRQSTSGDFQCSVFCGGRRCRYELPTGWAKEDMAVDGIYSHWVTNDVIAMARPNLETIRKFKVIEQFNRLGIKTLINLQVPGEHSSCGNPLTGSGFSYNPQHFMDNDVFFYNFVWKDYGTVSCASLLDMVKVVAFAVSEGKAAVHCHAGLGRTGVLIACYLIYSLRCKANDAIRYVRLKRPNSIQTRSQILCVQEFAQSIMPHFIVFTNIVPKLKVGNNLATFLSRQRQYLHGLEARHLKLIPKLLYVIVERLLSLAGCQSTTSRASSPRQGSLVASISYHLDTMYSFSNFFLSASLDDGQFRPISQMSVVESLGRSSDTSMDSGVGQSAGSSQSGRSDRQGSFEENGNANGLVVLPGINGVNGIIAEEHQNGVEGSDEANGGAEGGMYGDYDHSSGDESIDSMLLEDSSQEDLAMNGVYRELSSQAELRALDSMPGPSHAASFNAKDVAQALLAHHRTLGSDFLTALRQYQKDLNSKASAWDRLERESDLLMLTSLLWAWLEHLKDPILKKQDLIYIVLRPEKTVDTLAKLDRGSRFTMEYLIHFLARLHLESEEMCDNLLRRLIASLTHQSIMIKGQLYPVGSNWKKMRDGTYQRVALFLRRFFDIISGLPPKTLQPIAGPSRENRPGGSRERNYLGINIMAMAIGRSGSGVR